MSQSSASLTGLTLDQKLDLIAPAYATRSVRESIPESVGLRRNLSPLLRASCWGFEDVIQALIADGADSKEADDKGETALHKAARFAHLAVAVTLLRNRCNVDAVDHLGMTPLHWAALNGNTQLTRLFLLHRADVNIRDNYAGGMTAREMAELMGHEPVLAIMQKYRWASQ